MTKKKALITIGVICCIILIATIASTFHKNTKSKNEMEEYLSVQLKEPYEIQSEYDVEDGTAWDLYLPKSDITVTLTHTLEYNDAIHQKYFYAINDYYDKKFISLSDAREKLRKEKYPDITETIEYDENDNNAISCVFIDVPDLENDSEELYNYLIDVYNLNNFKYYNSYQYKGNELTELYMSYDIHFTCCRNADCYLKDIHSFSDLLVNKYCLPEDAELMSYEEFKTHIAKR